MAGVNELILANKNTKVAKGKTYRYVKGELTVVELGTLEFNDMTVEAMYNEMMELRTYRDQINNIKNGVTVVAENDKGFISKAFKMPRGSKIVPLQDIPKEISLKAYLIAPFYRYEEGFIKDPQKFRKYIAML